MAGLTLEQARAILERYTRDATVEERDALLNEKSITRTIAGAVVQYFDPYASALAYLFDPERVTQRTEGSVSETYFDPKAVAEYLRAESTALIASLPADDADSAPQRIDMRLRLRGWGN